MELTQEQWLEMGWRNGWASPPMCFIHDGLPMSEDELDDDWAGEEPCLHIMRLYEDHDHRLAVENANSAAVWRATNRGWTR